MGLQETTRNAPSSSNGTQGPRAFIGPHALARRWHRSPVTIFRMGRRGELPPRDARLGTRTGWWLETIVSYEARP
jgi:hypothetical protein